jgi:hypothetical protein
MKIIEGSEILLYESKDEVQSIMQMNQLIEEYAEELILEKTKMSVSHAIEIASERFCIYCLEN